MSYRDSKAYRRKLRKIEGHTLPAMEKKRNHPWWGAILAALVVLSLLVGWLVYGDWWVKFFSGLGR